MKVNNLNNGVYKERDDYLSSFDSLTGRLLWKECRRDPAVFAYKMLGIKLYGWQWLVTRELLLGKRRLVLNTSRQIGKSFLVSILSLWYVVFNQGHSSEFSNTKVGVISATEGQAKKLLLDIKNLMRVGDSYCKEHYSKTNDDIFHFGIFSYLIDDSRNAENTKTCITFKCGDDKFGLFLKDSKVGGFIKSLPPTDIVRGETFDFLIVDEASKVDDEIYNMAISKTGDKFDAVRFITSTPFGRAGFYYEIFDPEDKIKDNSWKRFWFTVDAIKDDDSDDYARRLKDIKERMQMGKNLEIRQEYYGEFVQSERSFFSPFKVDGMFLNRLCPVEKYSGLCDMGVDFGGLRKSKTVLTISCIKSDGMIYRIWHHAYEVRQDDSLIEDIADIKRRFNIQRIIVDDCPEGDFKIREMDNRGWEVTRMSFARDKVRKYGDFRSMLNKDKIKSYNDSDLMSEMKALSTAKGRERTKIAAPPGYSDDMIDSFVMSTYHYTEDEDDFDFYDLDEVKI